MYLFSAMEQVEEKMVSLEEIILPSTLNHNLFSLDNHHTITK